jgi:hypothetical protein
MSLEEDAQQLSDALGKVQPLKESVERFMKETSKKQHETDTMIFKYGVKKQKKKTAPFTLKTVSAWLEDHEDGADILEYLQNKRTEASEAMEASDNEEECLSMSKKRQKKNE